MSDVAKAIKKEQEYLSYRMKNKEPFHLIDAVKECGFESLNEYFAAKKEHMFSHQGFELIECPMLSAIDKVMEIQNTGKATVLLVNIDSTVVFPRDSAEYDKDFCDNNNIPILPVHFAGNGALVSTAGDLGIGICAPKSDGITVEFILDGFINIFSKYTDKPVYNDGNDIMVDGYKVCGFAWYITDDTIMTITPVSLTEKSELISAICRKEQNKVPSYIDFISREQLREEVSKWLLEPSI